MSTQSKSINAVQFAIVIILVLAMIAALNSLASRHQQKATIARSQTITKEKAAHDKVCADAFYNIGMWTVMGGRDDLQLAAAAKERAIKHGCVG